MSKILNVRNSFQKIKRNLEQNNMSCIFFNNHSFLYTTLDSCSPEYFMLHDDIFQKINTVRCSSITDFSKIETSLDHLEKIKNFSWDETTSILISDGYHTMDNFRSVDYVKEKFYKKFDYSIGIGNEFDSNLLEHIANTFSTQNDNNLFKFLFPYKDFVYIHIPKDTFFVTNKKFNILSMDDNDPLIEETDILKEERSEFVIKKTFHNLEKEKDKSKNLKPNKHHYLFIIDISGSMDDSIYSCLLHDEQEFDFFYGNFHTNNQFIKVNDPHVEIYFEAKKTELSWDSTMNEMNEIVFTCKKLSNIESHTQVDKLRLLYKLNDHQYMIESLNKFVRAKYNSLLNPAEKRMNLLLHENLTINYMNTKKKIKSISDTPIENRCSICLSNPKNILFSCMHVACCFDCVLKLLEPYDIPSCPICRSTIDWIRYIYNYDTNNNPSCNKCKINLGDVFQNPCGHILYCSDCCDSNENCHFCKKRIDCITKVNYS
jgi:hypothetical protein